MTEKELERKYHIGAAILGSITFLGIFIPVQFFHIETAWYVLVGLYPVLLVIWLKILERR